MLLRLALIAGLVGVVFAPSVAFAQRENTRDALARLEETLQLRLEEGGFAVQELMPVMVVSAMTAFEETRNWYPNAAVAALARVFGNASLRACEACMSPRLYVQDGRMEQMTTGIGVPEIVRFDEDARGKAPPAKSAIWIDETSDGVSFRMIDLRNSRIVLADNFDPGLRAMARSKRNFSLTRELERRARGDSLTHTFIDFTVYPGQHFSLDWVEQWGDTNANLSGVTVSGWDPVFGIGGAYYRVIPRAMNIMVGGKLIMSVPTALVQSVTGENTAVLDPLLTGVFMVRVPISTTNYGITFSASTNGRIGVGFTLMNFHLLPVLP